VLRLNDGPVRREAKAPTFLTIRDSGVITAIRRKPKINSLFYMDFTAPRRQFRLFASPPPATQSYCEQAQD